MTDQNLSKGDPVYPQYARVKRYTIEGNASPVSFVKGELATIDSDGFLAKLTTTKLLGLVQVMEAKTGGLAGDDTVKARCMTIGSRVILSLPDAAKPGDKVEINGTNGTGNLVVMGATDDLIAVGVGTVFELYRNTALKAATGDLGVVDLGLY